MENKNEIRESVSHLSLKEKKLKLEKFFNKIISVSYSKEIKDSKMSEGGTVLGTLVYIGETIVILKDVNNYEACIAIEDISHINTKIKVSYDELYEYMNTGNYKKEFFLDHIFSPKDRVIVFISYGNIKGKIIEYTKLGIVVADYTSADDYTSTDSVFIPYSSIAYIKKDQQ